ncbi:hypothetical protein ACIQF6_24840 [Kitasatospora sp. NPDC092948]|uniref:hypothetical protein n=1 Tax=Kitasatospora sp. NPDC092948 TaxID=3364088 RepID=UPI0037F19A57
MTGYDHWFRLELEVTGTANGRGALSALLAAQGWLVTELVDGGPRHGRWLVEAGVTGARAGAGLAVRLTLDRLVGRTPVDVDLRLMEPIVRQELPRGRYLVQRPARVPSWLRAAASRTRLFDTGRELFLPPGPDIRRRAGAEAVRALPGAPTPPADGTPRPVGHELDRPGRTSAPFVPAQVVGPVTVVLLSATVLAGVLLGGSQPGPAAWAGVLLVVALGGAAAGAAFNSGHWASGPRRGVKAALALATAAVALTVAVALLDSSAPGFGNAALVSGAILLCGNGLRLLLRGLTWQATAAWLVPALLPVVLVVLPGFGFSLHVFYMDGFGLNREDVQVPSMWQVIADTKALIVAVGPLVAVSLLGYARHLHAFRTTSGLSVAAFLMFCTCLGFVTLFQTQIMVPASHAAAVAQQQARNGRQPAAYFGIAPRRVCLRPVAEAGWDGAAPVAEHPYLVFPAAGDWAALWDVRTGETLNVKREQYRITDSTASDC